MNRRGLLATIHCAKRDLGLDEDTYRALLERVGGQPSARDLDDGALVRVVEEMRTRGWTSPARKARAVSENPLARKIWALWGDICKRGGARNPSRAALRAYTKRLTGVENPDWLSTEQATHVVENLKSWQARLKRKRVDDVS